jgi:ABC-type cobalamin/Fe3+-siderophores transport system ATPase subunit
LSERPTLEAHGARIDLLGHPLLARLDVTCAAERVALLGDWSPLFRLLSGEAQLSAGTLEIGGAAVPAGVEHGRVGVMRLDPLLPNTWSAEQLLASSAELTGMPLKDAQKAAFQTLERLGLGSLLGRRLLQLQLAERRALLVAHAVLTGPDVLCLEEPLAGLDTQAEQTLLAVLDRASVGRRLLVSLPDPDVSMYTRRLVQSCGERLGLAAGVAISVPERASAVTRLTATVCRNHQAFAAALVARGLQAHPTHDAGVLDALTSPSAGPCWRYLVELSSESTAAVLDAALETDAGLVELTPLH